MRLIQRGLGAVVCLAVVMAPGAATSACAAPSVVGRDGPEFRVTFDRKVRSTPATGRLVVYLVRVNSDVDLAGDEPASGPFFESPQPMYGIDVRALAPGKDATVDERATAFPVPLGALPPGRYKAQAVLDVNRLDSSWRREPGNLYSTPRMIELKSGSTAKFDIELTEVVPEESPTEIKGVEYVEVPSALLTKFRGQPVTLKAGVVMPAEYEPGSARKYAAVYEVPGFGGDHSEARQKAAWRRVGGEGLGEVMKHAFWIVLNPEGPNGHHLFADSDNNGPVGAALVQELIPALEKRYPLRAEPKARLLRGHSSGGWSVVWLALTYPETFGAAWSSSPDPMDFAHFQLPDIYTDTSMYIGEDGADVPSYRQAGEVRMTIRQENLMEEVLGPGNTSGQQWDSWLAVFGPRGADGNPAALYDPVTGVIDRTVAAAFRRYDVADLLRRDPARYGPIFKRRIRLICGERDNYFLNGAVASLRAEVEKLGKESLQTPRAGVWDRDHGYITLVPGRDHSSIYATQEMREMMLEMADVVRGKGR